MQAMMRGAAVLVRGRRASLGRRREPMPNDDETREIQIDEYMWPLTGEATPFDWTALTEELQIRTRLGAILAHVRDTHIAPRVRRLGPSPSRDRIRAVEESIIAGPAAGPVWVQTLREPVPRALRDEWRALTQRLSDIAGQGRGCGSRIGHR
jgi:hypothetical protein